MVSTSVVVTPTIRNYLHQAEITETEIQEVLHQRNEQKNGLEFEKKSMPLNLWENIIFSDESKFNLVSGDGQQYIWHKKTAQD